MLNELLDYVINWVEKVEGTKVKNLVLYKYNTIKPNEEVVIINLVDEVYKENPDIKPPYHIIPNNEKLQ